MPVKSPCRARLDNWIALRKRGVELRIDIPMWRLCKETLMFLRQEKKWWLIPLIIVLMLLTLLILFSGSSALAPFMYPFM